MSKEKIKKRWLFFGRDKYTYDTIEELVKKGVGLKIGEVVTLNGYYTAGDGANHKRIIANEDDGSGVQLNNGLWADIVHNGEVNVSWFGNESNNFFIYCYNKNIVGIIDKNITVNFISKSGSLKGKDNNILTFTSNGQLLFDNNMTIYLSDLILKGTNHTGYFLDFNNITAYLKNLKFDYDVLNKGWYCSFKNCKFIDIKNQEINNALIGYYFYKNEEIHIDNLNFKEHLTGIWFDCETKTPKEDKNNLIFISNIKGYITNRTFVGATNGKNLILGAGNETYISNITALNNIERGFYLMSNTNTSNITTNTTFKNCGRFLSDNSSDFSKAYISNINILADKFVDTISDTSEYRSPYFEFYMLENCELNNIKISDLSNYDKRIAISLCNTIKSMKITNISILCKIYSLLNFFNFSQYDFLNKYIFEELIINNAFLKDIKFIVRATYKLPKKITIIDSFINAKYLFAFLTDEIIDTTVEFLNTKINMDSIDTGVSGTARDNLVINLKDSYLRMQDVSLSRDFETLLERMRYIKKLENSKMSMDYFHCLVVLNYDNGNYKEYSSFKLITHLVDRTTQKIKTKNGIYTFKCGTDIAIYKVLGSDVTKVTETELFKQLGTDNTVTSAGVNITSYSDKIIELDYTSDNTEYNSSISQLNTPYMATKMQQEGVYNDFIAYMDEKIAYDKQQEKIEEQRQVAYEQALKENPNLSYEEFMSVQPMTLNLVEEPQPSEALKRFMKKYL